MGDGQFGRLDYTPGPGLTCIGPGSQDLWNRTKALHPALANAMNRIENDPKHFTTFQSQNLPPNVPLKPNESAGTLYVSAGGQKLDGSQIFMRQSELQDEHPGLPSLVLAHEVGHVIDRLDAFATDPAPNPNTYSLDIHGPTTMCTALQDAAAGALNISQPIRESFGDNNMCRADSPSMEAPIGLRPFSSMEGEP